MLIYAYIKKTDKEKGQNIQINKNTFILELLVDRMLYTTPTRYF